MDIRAFTKQYGLRLIPAPDSGLFVGKLVWDPLIGSVKMVHDGMPNDVYLAFRNAHVINDQQMNDLIAKAMGVVADDGALPQLEIEADITSDTEVQVPQIVDIKANISSNNILKFTFSDIKVKSLTTELRSILNDKFDALRASKWDHYSANLRRLFLVSKFYYGTANITIKRDFKAEIDAIIAAKNITATNSEDIDHNIVYSFSSNNVPFAMLEEWVKDYHG